MTAAEDPAMFLFLSGTLGAPKGIVRPHRGLLGIPPATIIIWKLELEDVLRPPVKRL